MQENLARADPRLLCVFVEKEGSIITELIRDFAMRFGACITIEAATLRDNHGRIFLLKDNLRKHVPEGFYYAGTFLGEVKNGRLVPGFGLLNLITATEAKRVFVDKKTEWLFICGRDVFAEGITKTSGTARKWDYVLVLNSHGECLGFGRVVGDLERKRARVAVKNLLDIGDFLRRER
jgi:ribosome biogenesis protein Nip4